MFGCVCVSICVSVCMSVRHTLHVCVCSEQTARLLMFEVLFKEKSSGYVRSDQIKSCSVFVFGGGGGGGGYNYKNAN